MHTLRAIFEHKDYVVLTHAQARILRRNGDEQALVMAAIPFAYLRAKRKKPFSVLPLEELLCQAFLLAAELVRAWNPRKQTWRKYITLGIRSGLYRYDLRESGENALARQHNRREVSLPEGACLKVLEEFIDGISNPTDREVFVARYGIGTNQCNDFGCLAEVFGERKNRLHYRIERAARDLHERVTGESLTIQAFRPRMSARVNGDRR
jgi:hypothetical protein